MNRLLVTLLATTACGTSIPSSSLGQTPSTPTDPPATTQPTVPPPAAPMSTLSIDQQGSGEVVVQSVNGVTNCQGSCQVSVPQGSQVSIIPHPADGTTVNLGDLCNGSAVAGSNDCNIIVNGDLTINIGFTPVPPPPPSKHVLVVNRTGNAACYVSGGDTPGGPIQCGAACSHDFDDGAFVTLIAQGASNDSAFVGWRDGPCKDSTNTSCTFRMDKDVTVTARCMKIICSIDP